MRTSISNRPTSGQIKTISITQPASQVSKKKDNIPSYNWSDAIERSVYENPMKDAGKQNRVWVKASKAKTNSGGRIVNLLSLKGAA